MLISFSILDEHDRKDEYFHVLSGEIEFQVGEEIIYGKEGTWVYAPRYIKQVTFIESRFT